MESFHNELVLRFLYIFLWDVGGVSFWVSYIQYGCWPTFIVPIPFKWNICVCIYQKHIDVLSTDKCEELRPVLEAANTGGPSSSLHRSTIEEYLYKHENRYTHKYKY